MQSISISQFNPTIDWEQKIMSKRTQLSASLEDYIEAIYNIVAEKQKARSKDIAACLNVSGASVTEALRSLSKKGLINYAPYAAITMTSKGRTVAKDVVRRHNALKQFFMDVLGIKNDIADVSIFFKKMFNQTFWITNIIILKDGWERILT